MFYTLTYFSLLKLQKPQNFYWISCWVVYLHTVLENKNIFTHSFFCFFLLRLGPFFMNWIYISHSNICYESVFVFVCVFVCMCACRIYQFYTFFLFHVWLIALNAFLHWIKLVGKTVKKCVSLQLKVVMYYLDCSIESFLQDFYLCQSIKDGWTCNFFFFFEGWIFIYFLVIQLHMFSNTQLVRRHKNIETEIICRWIFSAQSWNIGYLNKCCFFGVLKDQLLVLRSKVLLCSKYVFVLKFLKNFYFILSDNYW